MSSTTRTWRHWSAAWPGATDDVVAQQLIDWLAARWSSNRWSSRLLDPEPARQATQCARRQLDECERAFAQR